jgi:Transposase IS4
MYIANLGKFGFGASVVLHLSQRLAEPGHQLYMDNYFTTYQTLELLKAKDINAAGTIRMNRFNKSPLLSDLCMTN